MTSHSRTLLLAHIAPVRKSRTVLDSGFYDVDSGFQELDSSICQLVEHNR